MLFHGELSFLRPNIFEFAQESPERLLWRWLEIFIRRSATSILCEQHTCSIDQIRKFGFALPAAAWVGLHRHDKPADATESRFRNLCIGSALKHRPRSLLFCPKRVGVGIKKLTCCCAPPMREWAKPCLKPLLAAYRSSLPTSEEFLRWFAKVNRGSWFLIASPRPWLAPH